MNRILQRKVYLDEATGLPNKNKCEELLDAPDPPDGNTALCVFDLNNLRTVNNNLGHDKGDKYIRSFAEQLRLAVPSQHFVGRDGGDEFIAILYGVDWDGAQDVLRSIRAQTAEYSRQHPEMPLSYAAGCAIASDFEGQHPAGAVPPRRQEYVCGQKPCKIARRPRPGNCRTSSFCSGSTPMGISSRTASTATPCWTSTTSCAPHRASSLLTTAAIRVQWSRSWTSTPPPPPARRCGEALQLSTLSAALSAEHPKQELELDFETDGVTQRGRLTLLFCDADLHGGCTTSSWASSISGTRAPPSTSASP